METENKTLLSVLESEFISIVTGIGHLKSGLKHNANCTGSYYVDLDPIITAINKDLETIKAFCEWKADAREMITVTIWRGLVDGVEGLPAGQPLNINYYDLDLDPDAENVKADARGELFSQYNF